MLFLRPIPMKAGRPELRRVCADVMTAQFAAVTPRSPAASRIRAHSPPQKISTTPETPLPPRASEANRRRRAAREAGRASRIAAPRKKVNVKVVWSQFATTRKRDQASARQIAEKQADQRGSI